MEMLRAWKRRHETPRSTAGLARDGLRIAVLTSRIRLLRKTIAVCGEAFGRLAERQRADGLDAAGNVELATTCADVLDQTDPLKSGALPPMTGT